MQRSRVVAITSALAATAVALSACSSSADGSGGGNLPAIASSAASSIAQYESMSSAAATAALKGKLTGKKITVGTSATPNAQIATTYKTIEFLQSMFGLQVDFKTLDSDPLVAGTLKGDIEIGELSLAGMANAVASGADFLAFGADDQKNAFETAAKSNITSVSQLKGKPFAVTQNLTQITGQTAQKCLQSGGLTINDVQLVKLSNTSDTTQAIASGQVAAGATATFRMTKLYAADGESAYTILCKGWEINPQISDVWYSTSTWLKDNPDLALAFNMAAISANRWVKDNKQAWIDLAKSKVSGYTQQYGESDYNTLVNTLDDWPVNGSLDRSLCDSTLTTSLEFKAIPKAYTTDQLVTFVYQDAAVKILGSR